MTGTSLTDAQRAAWGWGTSAESEEARAFVAQRVALYARMVGTFAAALYVIGFVLVALVAPRRVLELHLHPTKLANLFAILVAFGVWWALRRPNRSPAALTAGDAALPLLVNLGVATAAPFVPPKFAFTFVPLLISALALMFRAALVPSPPARTAWVGALASLPTIWAQWSLAGRNTELPDMLTPGLIAVATGVWSLALVAGTALVSREIYGLRSEIAETRRLGQYTIERLIGEGGMGAVYLARHARLRRPTALKLLLPERTGPESIARFEREVQLMSQLTHPNTVAVYDYGKTSDGIFYYVMEYIGGLSLADLVERYGPQPPGRVIHILRQAADALVEAHALGLIHRDVKPANILLCERAGSPDFVKLLDFGLVKDVRPSADPALTQTTAINGTPLYLAPELITEPSSVDHRVDLYALGAVGYCLLTGAPPFQGRSIVEVCSHHLHTPPEPPSARRGQPLPVSLEALVLRCLAKGREERPASARELASALCECAKEAPFDGEQARAFWRGLEREKLGAAAPGEAGAVVACAD